MSNSHRNNELWDPWVDGNRPASARVTTPFPWKITGILALAFLVAMAMLLFVATLTQQAPVAPAVVQPIEAKTIVRPDGAPIIQAPEARLAGAPGAVWCLAFSPDGRTLAAATGQTLMGPSPITLWDMGTRQVRDSLAGHSAQVRTLAFSPDGKTLASAGYDGAVKLWDVETGEERFLFPGPRNSSTCVAFSPDGETLAIGGGDRQIEGPFYLRFWDLATKRERGRISELKRAPTAVAYSPDGKTFALAGGLAYLELLDVESGVKRATLHGHFGVVTHAVFSHDSQTLATDADDGHVRLWDVSGSDPNLYGRSIADWKDVSYPAFSPDGSMLAVCETGLSATQIQLRDRATGKVRAIFLQQTLAVAFPPDGALLASSPLMAEDPRTIDLWDARAALNPLLAGPRPPRPKNQ